jgi:hypothetical protein
MKTDPVYNLIILDESGSMEAIKLATISGFNEVVQTIKGIEKKFSEQKHFISLVTFNGFGIKTILDKSPAASLHQIDPKTYRPDSMTPLYDAIALSVLRLKIDIAEIINANVLVTILTDGEENASKEFNHTQVNNIISEQKNLGWTFTYIGANHDVERVAHSISITNTMKFEADEDLMKQMFLKENLSRYRFSEKISMKEDPRTGFYDEEDKDNATHQI